MVTTMDWIEGKNEEEIGNHLLKQWNVYHPHLRPLQIRLPLWLITEGQTVSSFTMMILNPGALTN